MKVRFIAVFLLLSCLCSAQETDSLTVSQDSAQSKNIIDRVMSLFEYNRGRTSVKCYPSAGIDPASGISVGILSLVSIAPKESERKFIRFYRPTSISTMAQYSTKNWLNLKSDMIIYASHGVVVNTVLQYQISPDKFYGIGNDTLNTNPVKFDMKDLRISGNVSKEITSTFYLGFTFDISHRKYASQGMNEDSLDVPVQKNSLLIGFGPHFTFDRRDNINYPTHGEFVTVGVKYFAPHNDDAYSFYSVEVDARKFITLYKDLILALQGFVGTSEGDMPFYSLFQLGGQSRLRGLSNKYMYIDKNAVYVQGELRKHIWNRFSAVIFGGFGNTSPKMSDMRFEGLKYVYGGGIRFQSDTKNNINLRLDYGRGKFGDSGVYMTMREAF